MRAADPLRRALLQRIVSAGAMAGAPVGVWPQRADGPAPQPGRLRVGPGRVVRTLRDASRIARDGTLVEVDAGDYRGDTAVWQQDELTVRAVGGRVRLIAEGAAAEGKGLFVVRGGRIAIEGFDFEGAAVPSRNGAGIRLDRGALRVIDCRFTGNEMGLLTGNDPATTLEVVDCEFAHNRRPDGHNHQLYAGAIARLAVTGSHLHHGFIGHLLKSRAAWNHIAYNRLADEADGESSYELEFPNGGMAFVIGNLIQQSPRTRNVHLVSYGAEGYRASANELVLVHNTLIDPLPGHGVFARVLPGARRVRLLNNLLVGDGRWDVGAEAEMRGNHRAAAAEIDGLDSPTPRLRAGSGARADGIEPAVTDGVALLPDREFKPSAGTVQLATPPTQPGAFQSR
jgi:hypothetical protein